MNAAESWVAVVDPAAPAGDGLAALARLLIDLVAQDRQAGAGAPVAPAYCEAGQKSELPEAVRPNKPRARRQRENVRP